MASEVTESLRLVAEKYKKSIEDLFDPILEQGQSRGHIGLTFNIFTLILGLVLTMWVIGLSNLLIFTMMNK